MDNKILTTDTLKFYEKKFSEFVPTDKPMSQTDKDVVKRALKRFRVWVDTYEERLFIERENERKKAESPESPMNVSVAEKSEEEKRDELIKADVDSGVRTILTLGGWFECIVWALPRTKESARAARRAAYAKFLKGGYYNKEVQTVVKDAVNRVAMI